MMLCLLSSEYVAFLEQDKSTLCLLSYPITKASVKLIVVETTHTYSPSIFRKIKQWI